MKKLLLTGTESIHLYNYYNLIKDYFDEILIITNSRQKKLFDGIPSEIINDSLRNPFDFYRSLQKIKKIVHRFRPDIVHSHQVLNISRLTLMAVKGTNIPMITTAWGSDILHTPKKAFFYKKSAMHILNNVRFFTSDSLYMASEMEKLAGKNLDITIANFGINLHDTMPVEKQNLIYTNRLLEKIYRIDAIIRAFAKFTDSRKNENWQLVIAGTGSRKEALQKLTKELNIEEQVRFTGWLTKEQNTDYYNKARFYVSVPLTDATSISLLEAMYMGCVPVLSNLPANTEWVINGHNGLIVSALNHNFFEEALKISPPKAAEINKKLITEKGLPEANRKIFTGLYDRVLAAYKHPSP